LISSDVAAVGWCGVEAAQRSETPLEIAGASVVIALGALFSYGRRAASEKEPPR
jgi:lysozyme family protein